MSKTIILTGGCGFIGHHFAEHIHKNTNWNIIIIDKLNYASMGLDRLRNNKLIDSYINIKQISDRSNEYNNDYNNDSDNNNDNKYDIIKLD